MGSADEGAMDLGDLRSVRKPTHDEAWDVFMAAVYAKGGISCYGFAGYPGGRKSLSGQMFPPSLGVRIAGRVDPSIISPPLRSFAEAKFQFTLLHDHTHLQHLSATPIGLRASIWLAASILNLLAAVNQARKLSGFVLKLRVAAEREPNCRFPPPERWFEETSRFPIRLGPTPVKVAKSPRAGWTTAWLPALDGISGLGACCQQINHLTSGCTESSRRERTDHAGANRVAKAPQHYVPSRIV